MEFVTPRNVKRVLDYGKTAYTLYTDLAKTFGRMPPTKRARYMNTTTPRGTVRRIKKKGGKGADMSKSKGFLKKGPKYKKLKKRPQIKYNKTDSFAYTIEVGKVQAGTNCVWIGHSTFPKQYLVRLAAQHILCKLLRGGHIDGMTQPDQVILAVQAGDTIEIDYYQDQTAAVQTAIFTTPVGGVSFYTFFEWFAASGRGWNNPATPNFILDTARWRRVAGAVSENLGTLSLRSLKIKYFIKSHLKIQNRSKAAAVAPDEADQTDVVDNVPVYGKSYSGKGNALLSKLRIQNFSGQVNIVGDSQFGLMLGSESVPGRSEPPQANEFYNVSNSGKIHLDPSEIKTSVLTSKIHIYLNDLLNIAIGVGTASVPTTQGNIDGVTKRGLYRVFAVEKMIDVGAAEGISVAFEMNTDIYSTSYIVKKPMCVKQFEHTNLA